MTFEVEHMRSSATVRGRLARPISRSFGDMSTTERTEGVNNALPMPLPVESDIQQARPARYGTVEVRGNGTLAHELPSHRSTSGVARPSVLTPTAHASSRAGE